MPNITVAQHVAYIAYATMTEHGNRHVAVAFNNTEVLAIGVDTRMHGNDPATAAVNLLQGGYAQMPRDRFDIVLTYPPTEACLGMAKMIGARNVFHYDGNVLRRRVMGGNRPWAVQAAHAPASVSVASEPPNFHTAATQAKAALARTWWNQLHTAFIHPDTRNFFIYAEHCHIYRNVNLPAQIGVLPALQAPLTSALTTNRRAMLTVMAQVLVAAVGFRDRRGLARNGGTSGHVAGHNIGCIVTTDQGEIIEWGVNLGLLNPTLHAETYAVMRWMARTGRQNFPQGVELFTTLESCYMCAGVIHDASDDMRATYILKDPLIVNSALEASHRQGQIASHRAGHVGPHAHANATDFEKEFRRTFPLQAGRQPQTTAQLNSTMGFVHMSEAVHAYKRMSYELAGDDFIVWQQGAGLINSITPNLV